MNGIRLWYIISLQSFRTLRFEMICYYGGQKLKNMINSRGKLLFKGVLLRNDRGHHNFKVMYVIYRYQRPMLHSFNIITFSKLKIFAFKNSKIDQKVIFEIKGVQAVNFENGVSQKPYIIEIWYFACLHNMNIGTSY